MARFEFTVPTLAPPLDQRVRLDTAADNSGTSVTDVLIGGRVADPAQGFDLRGVATFLGPDGVDTLYLKALNYRGKVIGAAIALAGVASGGGSVPSVHHFDAAADASGVNTALVAGVSTGIVIPAGSFILPATAASSVFAASLPADWDGTSPGLGFGTTQAEAIANVTAGTTPALVFDLDGVEDAAVAGFGTVIAPSPGAGTGTTGSPWYCPDETTLWVALGVLGTGGDPGSTTGTAKLLVAYTPPAA